MTNTPVHKDFEKFIVGEKEYIYNYPERFDPQKFDVNINASGKNAYINASYRDGGHVRQMVLKFGKISVSRGSIVDFTERYNQGRSGQRQTYKVTAFIHYEGQEFSINGNDVSDEVKKQLDALIANEEAFVNGMADALFSNPGTATFREYLFNKVQENDDIFVRSLDIDAEIIDRFTRAKTADDISSSDWLTFAEAYKVRTHQRGRKAGAVDIPGLNLGASMAVRKDKKTGELSVKPRINFTFNLYREIVGDEETLYFGQKPWEKNDIGDMRTNPRVAKMFGTKATKGSGPSVVEQIITATDAAYERNMIDNDSALIDTLVGVICHIRFELGNSICAYTMSNQPTKISYKMYAKTLICLTNLERASFDDPQRLIMERFQLGEEDEEKKDKPEISALESFTEAFGAESDEDF